MQTKTTTETGVDDVAGWRREQLTISGFEPTLAAKLAGDSRYDLHALIQLVEHGCRPDLAARILAPLEEGNAA
jgi:hypothetical protein